MKIYVEKDAVVKELDNNGLAADYVAAGWKVIKEPKPSLITKIIDEKK